MACEPDTVGVILGENHCSLDVLNHFGTIHCPHTGEFCWNDALPVWILASQELRDHFCCSAIHGQPSPVKPNDYRLVFGEADFLPGLVVERYGDTEFCAALRTGNTFAFQFHPPTSVRAYGSPGFWGWMVTPKEPTRAEQQISFNVVTTAKSAETQRRDMDADRRQDKKDKKEKGPYK